MKFSFFLRMPRLLLAAGLVLSHSAAPAADKIEDWIKILPKGACVFISVKDTPELVKDWDASGVGRFIEDEAVKRWMAPVYEGGEAKWDKFMKEELGSGFREGLSVYPGASLTAFVLESAEDFSSEGVKAIGLSEINGKEAELEASKERQLEAHKKGEYPDAVLKSEDVDGVKVHAILDGDGDDAEKIESWAVVNGILIETEGEGLMEDMLARVKGGQGEVNPAAAHLARVAEIRGEAPDITILADLDHLIGIMKEKMREEQATGGGGMGMPFKPEQLLQALGLDELHAAAACIDLANDVSRADVVLLHDEKPQGLLPTIIRGTSTEVPLPSFVPAGADMGSVSRTSLAGMYDATLKALEKMGPLAAMMTMQLGELEKTAGVNVRNDLLGSLDDVYVEITTMAPAKAGSIGPATNQVSAFKLKNRGRFQSAFDALWKKVGNGFGVFEESDYEGQTIYTLKSSMTAGAGAGGTPGIAFGYAITDEYLLLVQGSPDLLHKVLGRLKTSQPGTSLWDQPESQAALAALPKGYTGVGVSNGGNILRTLVSTMSEAQSMIPGAGASENEGPKKGPKGGKGPKAKPTAEEEDEEDAGAPDEWFDPEAAPPDEIFDRYFGVGASGVYSLSDATHWLYISQPAEKK